MKVQKPQPFKLTSFKSPMVSLVVDSDAHCVVVMSNRVSFIDVRVWGREEFEADYHPARLVSDGINMVLRQFHGYACQVGMTPEAAVYLQHLIKFDAKQFRESVTMGMATKARIKKEAQRMEQEDKAKGTVSGAAPRKLAGAAAAAVKRKEERLAAEAKKLAGEVSDDQTKLEASGAADARLPAQTGGRKKGETAKKPAAKKTETAKKEPKVTKSTPSPDQAKRILKGSARSDSQVTADSQFDPSKLKNADGDYKSASAMFKGLLFEGKKSDDAIAKEVDKKFGLGEQKAKDYVKWNRGWFRRQGVKIADPK